MSPLTSSSSQPLPAIGGYTITEQLYWGSRTAVYRAVQDADQRSVVLKILLSDYPTFGELVQFRNQYAIAKNLNLSGIIHPLTLQPFGNGYVLVMEDWGGVSLNQYLQQHELNWVEVLKIALQLTTILHDLHQQRVIHKDIKPANILIDSASKEVKLIDFSIASLLPKETQEIQNPNILEGTLAYLAPEQTGRMNRGIDYRADYYALGVTLYQLLAGQLPFESDDPLELLHCHIAKATQPVDQVNPSVPEMVGAIVAKLMAKNAEDRYQSALGLQHDLQQCLSQWEATGTIASFKLGQRDLSDRFLIPEKLYGRESEVQILLKSFERVSQGASELMLVAGFSGIGKTAVVNEVHKPITQQKGYFIKGKFDQFNRNIPLSAFVQALRDLMGQLLSESDSQLAEWKAQILKAVGENGQVLIEVIPELEQVIGQQPVAPELSGSAAQNRFNLLFQKFIQVFTTANHPLVIFLDDLQWSDSASLQLLKVLMESSGYLLMLGAYRDNEVSPVHPLMLTIGELEKANLTVNTITLLPLSLEHTNCLVADTLKCSQELSKPLTQLVDRKTQGNPFFTTQFLKALHEDGYIVFDRDQGYWQCDIAQVNALALTDDVVEFMALQLQKLPTATQEVLKLAACIGAQFDLSTLAIVAEQSQTEVATFLWRALQEGLIVPIGDVYKFYIGQSIESSALKNQQIINYKFLHDRVQQAAYSLIPDDQKQVKHLKIGQLLARVVNSVDQEERIFEVVNQLNQGADLIKSQDEREELAKLNLKAARKAKLSTAYIAAIEYADQGIKLLALQSWKQHYEITLSLYNLAAEVTCLVSNFEKMQQLVDEVVTNARHVLDKAKVYEVKILAEVAQSKQPEAIKTALSVLELFGIVFPGNPNAADISRSLKQTQELLKEKDLADLLLLPEMTDLQAIAQMRILATVTAAVYQAVPELLPLIVCKQIELSVQYGSAAVSAQAFAWYGVILCITGEIDLGNHIGEIALGLLSRFQNREFKASTINMVYPFVKPWKHHIKNSLAPLLDGYYSGLETGTLEYAAYCAYNYCSLSYFLGKDLSTLEPEIQLYNQALAQIKQEVAHNYLKIFYQSIMNLAMQNEHPWKIQGEIYDENNMLPLHQKANDLYALGTLYVNKLILCYLFGEWESATTAATQAKQYLGGISGCFMVPLFHFYDSLTYLAKLSSAQNLDLQRVAENQNLLKKWSNSAPTNYLHKFYLVEAEQHRVLGQIYEAMDYYDRAIANAKESGYIQEEALANEIAAKFYLNWGKEKVATSYMQEAYYCYARWGAKAKVADLEQRYPQLLQPILKTAIQSLTILETLTSINAPGYAAYSTSRKSSSSSINQSLDLATLLQISQTFASTIALDELLQTLAQTMLENSGADRCALMLCEENQWQVRVIADLEQVTLQPALLDNNLTVPVKLIQYVKNTATTVMVDDLKTDLPVIGNYLNYHQPKSVLCLPVLNQGSLHAILYLENQSTSGVFTSDRVAVLSFLCTQAAISLRNADLYQTLQNSEAKFRRLVEGADDMIWSALADSTLTYLSPQFEPMFKLSLSDWVGQSFVKLVHPDDIEIVTASATAALETGKSQKNIEFRHLCQGKEYLWVTVNVTPIKNLQGQSIGLQGIIRDISDRKAAEAIIQQKSQDLENTLQELQSAQLQMVQSEKMASLGNLVAGVAHEINNPIGFLNGSINNGKEHVQDLLEHLALYQQHYPSPTPPIQDHAEDIDLEYVCEDLPQLLNSMQGATDRIKSISTSLRTFSRADTEYKVSANLHEGIDSTLLILKYRLKANANRPAIEVITNYGEIPPIDCFPGQLNQVFMNILANAIDMFDELAQGRSFKELEAHPQQITISTTLVNNQVQIAIRDNGKGMDAEVQSRIFDHLFTTKSVGKGTGLGLAIAQQIVVDKHSGSLTVESELGQGTEFLIRLPIKS
ncbi:hypothetical protein AMR42_11130 [Limnothrix sp. PR1529]|uniref:trifunctional serine/threonine-protein kinase/ATP-binding protein/sensor histidine kinase n=1 Tax=Limnothrix sp. PR1529 TaxID=1704291 RepID=UPI000C152E85|nr:AAA family ATPase [Limnothrix sp. PR1529]PIB10038.1 hypothetical protein AMR42_11130 [Limnothrix sp. PR1529]